MHLKILTAVICLFVSFAVDSSAQVFSKSTNFKRYYEKLKEPRGQIIKAGYNWSLEKAPGGIFVYKEYHPEKYVMNLRAEYADGKMTQQEGKFQTYYDNGVTESEGVYKDNRREGLFRFYFFDTGLLMRTASYENGVQTGEETHYGEKGTITAIYDYFEGKKSGKYQLFHNGNVYEKGMNVNGMNVPTRTEKYPENAPSVDFQVASFKGCDRSLPPAQYKQCFEREMLTFIYGKIKYPRVPRMFGAQGQALFRFYIDEEGKIQDIITWKGVCKDIEKECKRIINSMPAWHPATKNGEPAKCYFNLPVNFKLE